MLMDFSHITLTTLFYFISSNIHFNIENYIDEYQVAALMGSELDPHTTHKIQL